jgi:hypothetical protein
LPEPMEPSAHPNPTAKKTHIFRKVLFAVLTYLVLSSLAGIAMLIAAAAPNHVLLWLVPHAGHTMVWAVERDEFESRLLGWFASHNQPRRNIVNPEKAAAL